MIWHAYSKKKWDIENGGAIPVMNKNKQRKKDSAQ